MSVYKDHLYAARCRLDQLADRPRPQETEISPDLAAVHGVRSARVAAGCTGLTGFTVVVGSLLVHGGVSAYLLIGTWVAMGLAYVLTQFGGRFAAVRRYRADAALSGDVFADLARLESRAPLRMAVARTDRLEQLSFALPLAVFALLVPLSLHFLFSLVFLALDPEVFGGWMQVSYILVGHAHLTLLVFAVMHVSAVRAELSRGVEPGAAGRGFKALLWTTLVSALPGIILFCIPPALVFLTGLFFVPWSFSWATRAMQAERITLERHGADFGAATPPPDPAPDPLSGPLPQPPPRSSG